MPWWARQWKPKKYRVPCACLLLLLLLEFTVRRHSTTMFLAKIWYFPLQSISCYIFFQNFIVAPHSTWLCLLRKTVWSTLFLSNTTEKMIKIVLLIVALVAVAFAADSESICRRFCKNAKNCQERCAKILPQIMADPVAETSSDMTNAQGIPKFSITNFLLALPMIAAAGLAVSSSGNCHEQTNPRMNYFF